MKVTKLKLGSRARRRFSRAGGAVGEGGLVDLGRLQWQCDCESSVLCPGSIRSIDWSGTVGPSPRPVEGSHEGSGFRIPTFSKV